MTLTPAWPRAQSLPLVRGSSGLPSTLTRRPSSTYPIIPSRVTHCQHAEGMALRCLPVWGEKSSPPSASLMLPARAVPVPSPAAASPELAVPSFIKSRRVIFDIVFFLSILMDQLAQRQSLSAHHDDITHSQSSDQNQNRSKHLNITARPLPCQNHQGQDQTSNKIDSDEQKTVAA